MATVDTLLTAKEFWMLPDDGQFTELVRGRIVIMNMPGFRHGEICGNIVGILREHIRPRKLGRAVCNDSGVQTERDPDTVRGADVAYYSFARLPARSRPNSYPDVSPEIAFEVKSPSDRWSEIEVKAGEYLGAHVPAVCVADPETETITVYRADQPPRALRGKEELTFPGIRDEFHVRVSEFFE